MPRVFTYQDAWDSQTRYKVPHGWVQWKGTDVCMDVHCGCGALCHIDSDFAYNVQCPHCNRIYFVNGHVELIEITDPQNMSVKLCDTDDEMAIDKAHSDTR